MRNKVTVKKAIRRGHVMVNLPVFIALFSLPGIAFYLSAINKVPDGFIGIGLLLGFAVAWLCWSILITKWRIWAFENVRNVHDLKKKSIEAGLIWPDGSWPEKTEIRSSSDKKRLKEIEKKFEKPDLFKEDIGVSLQTIIYFSQSTNLLQLVIMLGCLCLGMYILIYRDSIIVGALMSLFGVFMSIKEYKELTNTDPQITLNSKGIETNNTPFYEWSKIKNEEVVLEGSGKHKELYLIYDHPHGSERLSIADLDTDREELEGLLRTYRIRFEKLR